MAGEASPKFTYPGIPVLNWWRLRERLKATPSARVTAEWLAQELHMTEKSAQANVLPTLIAMGLVDSDGALTERGQRWRIDSSYPQVCDEILSLYPPELRKAYDGPGLDTAQVADWIMAHAGVGSGAAERYARVYVMLNGKTLASSQSAKPKKAQGRTARTTSGTPRPQRTAQSTTAKKASEASAVGTPGTSQSADTVPPLEASLSPRIQPAIHIDIQIHIPPDASPQLIDQIFSSMARQLKDL